MQLSMYLLHVYFKPQSKSTRVNFHPESAWPFGCMPLQLRLNKTRNQLEHAEGTAQLPKKSQLLLPICDLSVLLHMLSLTPLNTKPP